MSIAKTLRVYIELSALLFGVIYFLGFLVFNSRINSLGYYHWLAFDPRLFVAGTSFLITLIPSLLWFISVQKENEECRPRLFISSALIFLAIVYFYSSSLRSFDSIRMVAPYFTFLLFLTPFLRPKRFRIPSIDNQLSKLMMQIFITMLLALLFGVTVYSYVPTYLGGGFTPFVSIQFKNATEQEQTYLLLDENEQWLILLNPSGIKDFKGILKIPTDSISRIEYIAPTPPRDKPNE